MSYNTNSPHPRGPFNEEGGMPLVQSPATASPYHQAPAFTAANAHAGERAGALYGLPNLSQFMPEHQRPRLLFLVNHCSYKPHVKFCGPPLALDRDVFPRPSKTVACVQAKLLQNLEDLAHTVDKHFVLAFPAEVPISPLESPLTAEETLIQLDCFLSWCRLVLKQLANQQKMRAT
ncbi:hypothetical protein DSO57_1030234 [Entomophthora muscae]|uniref:Uncharacterized protein n=1 Tax=Entomophthora muscae TaxID=34485 RepID=A0ACC2TZF6_9FUNG|nr:hypothetical protein DSO57_1030234 [Entomophthora muscae]